ncbi:MAG: Endodeoxyribonuclease RusA [Methanomassiliicoccales archaeon PtaU1.Bin124]|nr:MAG: Endodeoxyribonuclease RusA [Methanomassiliicoccales archaeon PtaU1.Bin124]
MGCTLEFDSDFSTDSYEQSPVEDFLNLDAKVGSVVHSDLIDFFVAGEPIPQGSTKSFYIKKLDRVVTTHGNRNTERWRQRIATEAQHTNESRGMNFFCDDRRCGYQVCLEFVFTKPKSTPKKHNLNTKRPDLDKLIRAVLDGITGVLIPDDAQVVSISASKSYCCGDEAPGLHISVKRLNG